MTCKFVGVAFISFRFVSFLVSPTPGDLYLALGWFGFLRAPWPSIVIQITPCCMARWPVVLELLSASLPQLVSSGATILDS